MLARTLQPKLSESWGRPVLVENRTGGAGTMQAATVATATPDGHTLLLISAQFAIGAALRPKALPYDTLRDFSGVTQIGFSTSALLVQPGSRREDAEGVRRVGTRKPGKLLFSSGAQAAART